MTIVQLTTDNRQTFREYDNPDPHFGPAPEALLQGFALLPEVTVHVIGCTQQPMVSSPEKIAPNLWFHSLHVPKLGWMRTAYQGCVRAIRRRLQEIGPEIVHGQGTERECALGAAFSSFPNVITIHGNMAAVAAFEPTAFGRFFARCAALCQTVALRRTAGVFCNSDYTRKLIEASTPRTWLVPNALRLAFFDTPVSRRPEPRPVLLNIGVISPRKRQLELLDLARNLHAQGGDFLLKFVGPLDVHSPYGKAFADKLAVAAEAGYAQHVGTLGLRDLISLLDSASALVHVPGEEAFGLVVAEALARNLKLFATGVGGIPDIADGVEGAELFAPSASQEMIAAMRRWLATGASRPTRAAEAMQARYHPKLIAQRHVEIYREVLGRPVQKS